MHRVLVLWLWLGGCAIDEHVEEALDLVLGVPAMIFAFSAACDEDRKRRD